MLDGEIPMNLAPATRNTLCRSRAEALANGAHTYFTGRPCKHGHIAARYTQGYDCSVCAAISRQSRLATVLQSVARDMGWEMHRDWAELLARDLGSDAWRMVATLRDIEGTRLESSRTSLSPRGKSRH